MNSRSWVGGRESRSAKVNDARDAVILTYEYKLLYEFAVEAVRDGIPVWARGDFGESFRRWECLDDRSLVRHLAMRGISRECQYKQGWCSLEKFDRQAWAVTK